MSRPDLAPEDRARIYDGALSRCWRDYRADIDLRTRTNAFAAAEGRSLDSVMAEMAEAVLGLAEAGITKPSDIIEAVAAAHGEDPAILRKQFQQRMDRRGARRPRRRRR